MIYELLYISSLHLIKYKAPTTPPPNFKATGCQLLHALHSVQLLCTSCSVSQHRAPLNLSCLKRQVVPSVSTALSCYG